MLRRLFMAFFLLGSLGWLSSATAPPRIAFFASEAEFRILRLAGREVRWFKRSERGETVLTYRIVNSTLRFDDAFNCRVLVPPDGISGFSTAMFRSELAAAFAMWSGVARLAFVEAANVDDADILIGAQGEPEGRAFTQVFYDAESVAPVRAMTRSLICLNPQVPWKIGFDGNLSIYDLRFTLAHEIGHAIGLDHPEEAGQLMGFRYDERTRVPRSGDIFGAALLYGARRFTETEPEASAPSPAVETR